MKILHIGLCVDLKNEGLPYALKEASSKYVEFNPGDPQLFEKLKRLNFDPDIIFCQIQNDKVQAGSTSTLCSVLRRFSAMIIFWNGDKRNGTPLWHFACDADLFLFSNMEDVNNCRTRGVKSDFLQIGIDPEVYKKWESNEQGNDIVYMGNGYNQFPESQRRNDMVKFLQNTYGQRFSVYGNGFQNANGENNADQVLQSKIYNNSKIGINHSQFNSERYTSDRMFRILGSGCMCISHHYKGIETDFEIGKHLVTFNNFDELKEKIDYYLANENDRKEIAEKGYNHCHSNFTYKHMVENLIEIINVHFK